MCAFVLKRVLTLDETSSAPSLFELKIVKPSNQTPISKLSPYLQYTKSNCFSFFQLINLRHEHELVLQ